MLSIVVALQSLKQVWGTVHRSIERLMMDFSFCMMTRACRPWTRPWPQQRQFQQLEQTALQSSGSEGKRIRIGIVFVQLHAELRALGQGRSLSMMLLDQ
jgi:hypothetical protein